MEKLQNIKVRKACRKAPDEKKREKHLHQTFKEECSNLQNNSHILFQKYT